MAGAGAGSAGVEDPEFWDVDLLVFLELRVFVPVVVVRRRLEPLGVGDSGSELMATLFPFPFLVLALGCGVEPESDSAGLFSARESIALEGVVGD